MRTRKITFGLILGAAITLSTASVQAGNSSFSISFSSGGRRCAPRSSIYYSSGGCNHGGQRRCSRCKPHHHGSSYSWGYSYGAQRRHCPPPRYAPPPRRCAPRPQHHCNTDCRKHGRYRNSGQSTVVIVNNNNNHYGSRNSRSHHGWQDSRSRYSNQMHNSPRHGWHDSRSRYNSRQR